MGNKKSNFYFCEECNIQFKTFQEKGNHVRWKHLDNSDYKSKMHQLSVDRNNKRYGELIIEKVKCEHISCNNFVEIKYRTKTGKKKKYFCSRKCANSRGPRNEEFKKKSSLKIKELWSKGHYDKTSALNYLKNPKIFSSKREREIVNFFKKTYPEDNWKSGGSLNFKDKKLSRDMYSDKLKVCFEYDGIWHFSDIYGQLKDKKYKDLLLENWCKENDYRLVRIDEDSKLSFEEIEFLIYKKSEIILKIGDRY